MADRPLSTTLPADLPTGWTNGQIIAPSGSSVGLATQYGYNYLMQQVNAAQSAANTINAAFDDLATEEQLPANTEIVYTLSASYSGTTHALTGFPAASGLISCIFTAAANYTAGDTFTVNGTPYTIQLSNGESAEDNLFVTGAAVPLIVDVGAKKVNFKSAGGGTKLPAGTTAIVQIYTQNDTFTVPQNGKYRITVIGAGGPGGSSTYGSAAAGGGSGAWCSSVLDLKKDDAYPITVDTSQSSFSSLMTATAGQKGGKGSSGSAAGGLGGNATGGNEHNIDGNTASSTSGSSWTSGTNGANIGSPSLSKFLSSAGGVGGKSGNSSSINNAGGKPPFLVDAKFGVFGNGGGGGGAARDFDSAAPGGSGAGGAVFIELVLE